MILMLSILLLVLPASSRDTMVIFHRHSAPDVELCSDGVEATDEDPTKLSIVTVGRALAFTEAQGARWGTVYISECFFPVPYGDVRIEVQPTPILSDDLAVTDWFWDRDGFATVATVHVYESPQMEDYLLVAHELFHSQGIGHPCGDPGKRECDESDTGSVMFPSYNYVGPGISGVRRALERVYADSK